MVQPTAESSMPTSAGERQFQNAEHLVELKSGELKKELRLGDLVLSQILYIMAFSWLAPAGKLGPGHVMYWIPAVLLFYVPSGVVVLHLNREMPLEGGLYQWAKLRLGAAAGFLVALNLWATVVLLLTGEASIISNNLSYLAGPTGAWVVENRVFTMALGGLLMGGLMLVAARGLALGRWFHNAGGLLLCILFVGMLLFALPRWVGIGPAPISVPAALALPAASLLNLNILGKMGFGAFCGLDGASIFSGECKDPDSNRTIRRAIWLAGPAIAAIYMIGTACVLTFSSPGDIDMTSPATQALSRGVQGASIAGFLVPFFTILVICGSIGFSSLYFNVAIRLPMVAGWDHLLPGWFSRLHPRFRTPVGSIVFMGLITIGLTILANLGVGGQEAFQTSLNAGIICWALTYIVMFSIPLIAKGERAPWGVRVAAVSGLAMTALYVTLSVIPIVAVKSTASFTAKVGGIVIAINAAGALYYWHASKHRDALTAAVEPTVL
jgi:glutamate:GABA antiporter